MGKIYYFMLAAVNSDDLKQITSMADSSLNESDGVVYIKENNVVLGYVTFDERREGDALKSVYVTSVQTTRSEDVDVLIDYIKEVFENQDLEIIT